MTIFFVAAHDPPTNANLTIAQFIQQQTDIVLFGPAATRQALHDELGKQPEDRTVFSMTHGSQDAVLDNNSIAALLANDGNALFDFRVFAWACHTGARLGHSLAQTGVTWWGYDSAITAPDDRAQFMAIFTQLFSVVRIHFAAAVDLTTINNALEAIKEGCDEALDALDSIDAQYDDQAFSLYSCCNQLWGRLSVWRPLSGAPTKHPEAPPAYIEI